MARKKASIDVQANVAGAIAGMKKLGASVDRASGEVGTLNDKLSQAGDGLNKFASLVKKGLAGAAIGAAIGAVSEATQRVVEFAEESRRVQGVFKTLPFDIGAAAQATGGFVNNMDLAVAAAKAGSMGVSENSQQFADLATVAAKAAKALGEDTGKSIDDLTTALARQSPMILDNLGVTLSLGEANAEWAAQNGRTVASMTDAEKKAAFTAIALQRLGEKYGGVSLEAEGAADAIIKAKVATENAELSMHGADTAAGALASSLGAMGDRLVTMDVKSHGADLALVEKELRKYGKTIEDVGGVEKIAADIAQRRTEILREQKQAAEEAAEAERRRIEQIEIAKLQEENTFLSRNIEMMQITGASAIDLAQAKMELAMAQLESAQATAEATGATEADQKALEEAMWQAQKAMAQLEAAERRRGRGGGRRGRGRGRDDAITSITAEANEAVEAAIKREQAIAEWNRRELDAKVAAKLEFEEWEAQQDAERLARLEEQAAREAKIQEELAKEKARIAAEEAKREMARREAIVDMSMIVAETAQSQVEALVGSAIAGEKVSKKEMQTMARTQSAKLGIQAAMHFARSAAYAIAGSPLAIPQALAGAKATAGAASVLALGEAFAAGMGGGGGGGSGNQFADSGAFNRGSSQQQQTQTAQDAPVSPLEGGGNTPAQSQAGGGPVVVNVSGSVLSQGDLARALRDALRDGVRV